MTKDRIDVINRRKHCNPPIVGYLIHGPHGMSGHQKTPFPIITSQPTQVAEITLCAGLIQRNEFSQGPQAQFIHYLRLILLDGRQRNIKAFHQLFIA